jgi:hypothetical protein
MMLPAVSFSTGWPRRACLLVSGETLCGNSSWIGRKLDDFFLAIGRWNSPEQRRRQKQVGYKRCPFFIFSPPFLLRFSSVCIFSVHQSCHRSKGLVSNKQARLLGRFLKAAVDVHVRASRSKLLDTRSIHLGLRSELKLPREMFQPS